MAHFLFFIFHALSFEFNFVFDQRFPLKCLVTKGQLKLETRRRNL